jgi:pimeloyl-ACP methyl ester carboxylesterase
MKQSSIHPIIYVRGYAMTQSEIEDTVADPYMGFNIGSSKVRQLWDGSVKKYFFESPLVRLLKRFDYDDVFEEGSDRVSDLTAPSSVDGKMRPVAYRSIVIYRYYEPSSEDLGTGKKPDMQRFASELGELILKLRKRIYPEGAATKISAEETVAGKLPYDRFRVHLIAHSMGGLVCRAFLQNFGSAEARGLVDKLFTYATPHNGIDIGLLGNVPKWLSLYGMNTFNRDEIARLLALAPGVRDGENVDVITNFDPSRVFNLVGTNPGDYKAAAGLSSTAVGDASDGLVRIKNATTRGRTKDGFVHSPQAFVHRSHSGFFGIVNSEEGYQNLVRFLFGDVRADGWLEIDELTLPPAVQEKLDKGHNVKASYLFEVALSLRGKPWQLHRRIATENSAIFRKYDDLFQTLPAPAKPVPIRTGSPVLFNVFLDMDQSQTGTTVSFALDLCVRVPEYVVDGVLFLKDHYEGGYLYRDTVLFEATPPKTKDQQWLFEYWFANNPAAGRLKAKIVGETENTLSFEVPIVQPHRPGIAARLRVTTSYWNEWNEI